MTTNHIRPQAAVIPIRDDGQICLITTSAGNKWGIPKGMIDPGFTAEEAALQEAWEEAGLGGRLKPEPAGTYQYQKWGLFLKVTVFVMDVDAVHDTWPEAGLRERRWWSPDQAVRKVSRPELRNIMCDALNI